jgi:guanylate kinase
VQTKNIPKITIFLSPKEFNEKVERNEFIEWEEVYEGIKYGTLRSELNRIQKLDLVPVFDVDVLGGVSLKKRIGRGRFGTFYKS